MCKFNLWIRSSFLVALMVVSSSAFAQGRDFSAGITNAGSSPLPASVSAERSNRQAAAEAEANAALASAKSKVVTSHGQLGPGDKVKVTVFSEPDLSGEFEIDNTGSLAMPLVGEIPVRGLTAREVEKKITATLEEGYLKSPRVNIEVLNFRPFFILGEVNKPGSYPYANDMNVVNAVALGGGYTTRAKIGKVSVRRASAPDKEEYISEDSPVYPGDVLRVDERFF
ncbi:MAG: polysaccharide biosynthesis protein [Pseudomonas fluorescens]|nr:MAG: polysaccharide biosynthesis protein [Pseudomonas fluorescens]